MKLNDALQKDRALVADGAWGTQLTKLGLGAGECPDLWSCTHFEQVVQIAASYINAGADIVETNSFGACSVKLASFGAQQQAQQICRAAAQATKEAAVRLHKEDEVVVAGSMGPCGKLLLMGDVEEDELYESFAQQAQALQQGGADAACIETMSDLQEAQIAIRAVRENTGLPVICLFTFAKTKQGTFRTMMGLSPEDAVQGALESGALVVGTNCGNGIEQMPGIIAAMKSASPQVITMVNANAGLPVSTPQGIVYPQTPEQTGVFAKMLFSQGVRIVGGCCGTTPRHIAAVRSAAQQAR